MDKRYRKEISVMSMTTTTTSSSLAIRICPTRMDQRQTLIREKVDIPRCEKRQEENFHKCHTCIYSKNCIPK
jgi:hypothetical protein